MPFRIQPLRLAFELRDDVGVEQLAHLDRAEQFTQQSGVDRQRGSTTLGERRIALVHERADVPEQQVARERRRLCRLGLHQPYAPLGDRRGEPAQRRQVVDVLQHLAQGLEDHGERRMPPGHLEQLR